MHVKNERAKGLIINKVIFGDKISIHYLYATTTSISSYTFGVFEEVFYYPSFDLSRRVHVC